MVRSPAINLVGQEKQGGAQRKRLLSVLKRTSFIVLALYFVALAAIFIVKYFFLQKEAGLVSESKSIISQVKVLAENEALLNTVKNRTSIAGNIINTSQAHEKLLFEVTSKLPPGAKVLQADSGSDSFNIIIETPDSKVLTQVFSSITNSQFTSIELSNLNLADTGVYVASLNIR
ncbi:MAG: hypothetical protein HYW33_02045 [Candidatus Blackburnbacteria bacterium]|nr:hypothetical protein [Candidatus Blackburnbacteria bacterium]